MSVFKTKDLGTIVLDQQDYLAILIEPFLIDRRAQGLSPDKFLQTLQRMIKVSKFSPDLSFSCNKSETKEITKPNTIPLDVYSSHDSLCIFLAGRSVYST